MVWTLHAVLGCHCHIVTKVVETELAVGTKGDVAVVGRTTFLAVGLSLVDTSHAQAVEHIERTHPFRVTFSKVVVDGNHMYTTSCQGIEEHWQGGNESLTLTSCHLGNLALMEHRATNELNIVVYHVPRHLVATGFPVVVVDGFIALNVEEVMSVGSEFAVEVGSGYLYCLVLGKSLGGLLDDSKDGGQHLVELLLDAVENFLLDLVNFSPQRFALLIFKGFDFGLNGSDFVALRFHILLNLLLDCGTAGTQFIVRQLLNIGVNGLNLTHNGHKLLEVTLTLVAEDGF